ncbi:MAG: hypothetical protein HZB12_01920 [Candidatus Yonathbacteria bacterium]|nr:hypothetical protein [Candidatus Yonathbacteria bacterium]
MRNTAFRALLFVSLTVLIGTGLDFLAHQIRVDYAVPSYYFPDKIIFGIIWGIVIYWFVSRKIKNRLGAALSFGAFLSALLQVRYFLEGYPVSFVLIFLGVHFVVFALPAYFLLQSVEYRAQ